MLSLLQFVTQHPLMLMTGLIILLLGPMLLRKAGRITIMLIALCLAILLCDYVVQHDMVRPSFAKQLMLFGLVMCFGTFLSRRPFIARNSETLLLGFLFFLCGGFFASILSWPEWYIWAICGMSLLVDRSIIFGLLAAVCFVPALELAGAATIVFFVCLAVSIILHWKPEPEDPVAQFKQARLKRQQSKDGGDGRLKVLAALKREVAEAQRWVPALPRGFGKHRHHFMHDLMQERDISKTVPDALAKKTKKAADSVQRKLTNDERKKFGHFQVSLEHLIDHAFLTRHHFDPDVKENLRYMPHCYHLTLPSWKCASSGLRKAQKLIKDGCFHEKELVAMYSRLLAAMYGQHKLAKGDMKRKQKDALDVIEEVIFGLQNVVQTTSPSVVRLILWDLTHTAVVAAASLLLTVGSWTLFLNQASDDFEGSKYMLGRIQSAPDTNQLYFNDGTAVVPLRWSSGIDTRPDAGSIVLMRAEFMPWPQEGKLLIGEKRFRLW